MLTQNPSTTFNNHWRPPKTFCVRRLNMYYIGSYVFLIYLKITNSLTINRNSVCIKNIFCQSKKKKKNGIILYFVNLCNSYLLHICFCTQSDVISHITWPLQAWLTKMRKRPRKPQNCWIQN